MIIDFHTHIFSPRTKENRHRFVQDDPCFAGLYSNEKAKIATADELIETMDSEGIDISVVQNIGWCSHKLSMESNDYIMEAVTKYPDRLIGFITVNPRDGDKALKEVERCAVDGIRGLGELRPDVQSIAMDDTGLFDELAGILIARDLIFLTHASEPVGHIYQGKGEVTPGTLYPFITRYPDLKIVLAHWGGGLPFYYMMPEVKKACINVYYDSAASPYLYDPVIYETVARLVGDEKILFGSDYPLMKPSKLLRQIESTKLTVDMKRKILSENAAQLLKIDIYKE